MSYSGQPSGRRGRHPALRLLLMGFLTGMATLPVIAGAAVYFALSGAFAGVSVDALAERLAGAVVTGPLGGAAQAPAPETLPPPPVAPTPDPVPAWTGAGRVNILLLGNDRREGQTDIPRTDTMMVLTLDTVERRAGLLSLPRDLWVTIPGHGNERINAAYGIGETRKRDGGPELARQTVEQLLGVPMHHHVVVGFSGFERVVDELGGVTVDIERPIKDDEYPGADHSMRRIFFQPGLQRLNGEAALWYVRTRHADSDFGRARRQQQFLLALRQQALQLNILPKAPAIIGALSDNIRTDLKVHEVLALARVAKDVDTGRVTNRVVDESMTSHWVTPSGAQVEVPDRVALRGLVQEVFGSR